MKTELRKFMSRFVYNRYQLAPVTGVICVILRHSTVGHFNF